MNRLSRTTSRIALVGLAATFGLVACGDDDSGDKMEETPSTEMMDEHPSTEVMVDETPSTEMMDETPSTEMMDESTTP